MEKKLREFNVKQIPKLSGKLNLDEFVFKVNKTKHYRWTSKDRKTKFRINAFSSIKRTYVDGAKLVYQDIKKRCYGQFIKALIKGKKFSFTTDKLGHYKKGFNKLFYRVAKLQFGVPIACKKHKLKHNNNAIERYNGKIKDRLNAMRGEFKIFERAKDFMNLQHIINNFVNPHQELKRKNTSRKSRDKTSIGEEQIT